MLLLLHHRPFEGPCTAAAATKMPKKHRAPPADDAPGPSSPDNGEGFLALSTAPQGARAAAQAAPKPSTARSSGSKAAAGPEEPSTSSRVVYIG